jgi:hypothetical protein
MIGRGPAGGINCHAIACLGEGPIRDEPQGIKNDEWALNSVLRTDAELTSQNRLRL